MNAPDRQLQIKKLFSETLSMGAAERLDWLTRQCGEDELLLQEVLSLLEHAALDADPLEDGLNIRQTKEGGNRGEPAFHVQCPHCHNPIELIAKQDPLAEVNCSSCGSSFKLLQAEDTRTWHPDQEDRIGRFQLSEKIGFGSFGSVFRAFDESLDRTVAVKIPRRDQLTATEAELFLREARATAQLRHPNIVSLHEVGIENDTIYLVSDFIDGLTVGDWLTGHRPDAREAVQLCLVLARALDHAHERGVIHRDLKPSNIMLDREQTPFLMDFGLAKRDAGEMTMTLDGQVIGTPAYMSPEQASGSGHTVDRRTDIYSLGVIFFELLTGERPFRGNTQMLIHQVQTEEAPSPRKFNATIPRDLETICQKCLEKDPDRRFKTASNLADELERWLSGTPILTRPVSPVERGWRWCLRHPMVATLSFLLLFTLTAGIAVSSWFAFQERERSRQLADSNSELEETNEDLTEAHRQQRLARYVGDMSVIGMAWESENLTLVNRILERNRPQYGVTDLRGFEWYYWHRLANLHIGEVTTDATSGFSAAEYSPDGSVLFLLDPDGWIQKWDLKTGGTERLPFRAAPGAAYGDPLSPSHSVPVFSIRPDGRQLLTLNSDLELVTFSIGTGRVQNIADKGPDAPFIKTAAWSPDGSEVVSCSFENGIQIRNAEDGTVKFDLDGQENLDVYLQFGPRDNRLWTVEKSYGNSFFMLERPEGIEMVTGWNYANREPIFAVNGEGTLSTTRAEGSVLFEFPEPTSKNNLFMARGRGIGKLSSVDFLHDGGLVVCGTDNNVYHLPVEYSNVAPYVGPRLEEVSFEEITKNQIPILIRQYATFEGAPCSGLHKMKCATNGQIISLAAGRSLIQLYDNDNTGNLTTRFLGHSDSIHALALSPCERIIATLGIDGKSKLWDLNMADTSRVDFAGDDGFGYMEYGSPVASIIRGAVGVCFNPNGKQLAVTNDDDQLRVLDAETLKTQYTLSDHEPVYDRYDPPNGAFDSLQLLPNGSRALGMIAGSPLSVLIVDTISGRELERFSISEELKDELRFGGSSRLSPDRKLMINYKGLDIELLETASGNVVATLSHETKPSEYNSVFSPDSQTLATVEDTGKVTVWDSKSGKQLHVIELSSQDIADLQFSGNGQNLVVAELTRVGVWDLQSGDQVAVNNKPELNSVLVSPNGQHIFISYSESGPARFGGRGADAVMWDVKADHESALPSDDDGYPQRVLAIRPDGLQYIRTDTWRTLALCDTVNGKKICSLDGHPGDLTSIAWTPDRKSIVMIIGGHTIQILDANSGKLQQTHKRHEGHILESGYDGSRLSVAFSPDGKLLATASADRTIAIRNAATGQRLQSLEGHENSVSSAAFFADGKQLVSGSADGTARIWDVESGALKFTLTGHDGFVANVAISPDNKFLATTSDIDQTVRIWRSADGKLQQVIEDLDGSDLLGVDICEICFSRNSNTLLIGTETNDAVICDLATGSVSRFLSGHEDNVRAVTYTSDGRAVTGSDDGTLRVWDSETGTLMLTLPNLVSAKVDSITASPNGAQLVAFERDGDGAVLYDVRSDTEDRQRCVRLESRCWRAEQLIDSQPAKAIQLLQAVLHEVDARLTNPPETGTWEKLLLPGRYQELKERCKSGIESIESKNRQAIH